MYFLLAEVWPPAFQGEHILQRRTYNNQRRISLFDHCVQGRARRMEGVERPRDWIDQFVPRLNAGYHQGDGCNSRDKYAHHQSLACCGRWAILACRRFRGEPRGKRVLVGVP